MIGMLRQRNFGWLWLSIYTCPDPLAQANLEMDQSLPGREVNLYTPAYWKTRHSDRNKKWTRRYDCQRDMVIAKSLDEIIFLYAENADSTVSSVK